MSLDNFLSSRALRLLIYCLIGLALLLVVFRAGMVVGFHQAEFLNHFGDNYWRNFEGPRPTGLRGATSGWLPSDLPSGHGLLGQIVKINLPILIVSGPDNLERSVVVANETAIHRFRTTVVAGDLRLGDRVLVLGSPNNQGQIEAKLIRLLPKP